MPKVKSSGLPKQSLGGIFDTIILKQLVKCAHMVLIPCLNRSRKILSGHCVGEALRKASPREQQPSGCGSVYLYPVKYVELLTLSWMVTSLCVNEEPLKLVTAERGLVSSVRSRKHKLLPSASVKEDLEGVVRGCSVVESGDAFS